MKVVALKEMRYGGIQRLKDEEFEMSARDARVLSLLGKVKEVDGSAPVETEVAHEEPTKPRRYKTRQMKAED